jgi:peptide/nickel transport system permease protein
MRAYVLKRLLLMIPTFAGIFLVLFLLLNLAPGRPGGTSAGVDLAASLRDERGQDSQRIFREQFQLDRPVLLNPYFALRPAKVRAALERFAQAVPATSAERVAAWEELEDWSSYAVPGLVAAMRDDPRAAVCDAAVLVLRHAAQRPLLDPFAERPDPATAAENRAREAENAELRTWRYGPGAPEPERREVIARWSAWYDAHASRWQWDAWGRLRVLLLETRLAAYVSNLARLDFGVSLVTREPVIPTLVSKLKYSITLSLGSLVLAYAIAIPLGVLSAVTRGSSSDRAITVGLFVLYSLPSFFVATLLLVYLSQGSPLPGLRLFPTGGWSSPDPLSRTSLAELADVAWHLVLPMACMTYGSLAALSRYMRSSLLDVIAADFVRTARAKGVPERTVVLHHALRNALLPILTLLGGLLPAVLGGSVIVEYVFGIPGMGLWVVDSIFQRDYNVILAVELLSTVLVLVGTLLTDLAYAWADPRIRYE